LLADTAEVETKTVDGWCSSRFESEEALEFALRHCFFPFSFTSFPS